MDLELKAETEKQGLKLVKITTWEWDMVVIAVMLIFQHLIWEICQSHPKEHPMNLKCQEMKVKVVLISAKIKCVILQLDLWVKTSLIMKTTK